MKKDDGDYRCIFQEVKTKSLIAPIHDKVPFPGLQTDICLEILSHYSFCSGYNLERPNTRCMADAVNFTPGFRAVGSVPT